MSDAEHYDVTVIVEGWPCEWHVLDENTIRVTFTPGGAEHLGRAPWYEIMRSARHAWLDRVSRATVPCTCTACA